MECTMALVRKVGWGLVVDAILMLKVRLHKFFFLLGGVCLKGHQARPAARGLLTVNRRLGEAEEAPLMP